MSIKGFQIGEGSVQKYDYTELDNKPTVPVVDATLTTTGAAADAKKTGDEIADLKSAISQGTGLTNEAKQALLALLANVAYIDDDGQDYYDALEAALYPPVGLTSISAVFTQGQAVIYDTDSLDTLKQYLVVTAHYEDQTTETITGYTLSGTLSAGTSTITVTYSEKTASFSVTVTSTADMPLYPIIDVDNATGSGRHISVSSGNHIEWGSTVNSKVMFVFTDGAADSYVANKSQWFSLSQGDEYELKIKNIVFTSNNSDANKLSFVFKRASENVTVFGATDIPVSTTGAHTLADQTITGTIETNDSISGIGFSAFRPCEYSCDIELWVNDHRYV